MKGWVTHLDMSDIATFRVRSVHSIVGRFCDRFIIIIIYEGLMT